MMDKSTELLQRTRDFFSVSIKILRPALPEDNPRVQEMFDLVKDIDDYLREAE